MGLATIDPHSQKDTPKFTKYPSLVLIGLVLTEIQAFRNVKNYKEMYGNADKSGTPTVYPCNSSIFRELPSPVTKLRLLTNGGSSLHIRVNVVPKITGNLQGAYFNPEKLTHLLKNISLADSVLSTEETIKLELFIAYDYESDIFFFVVTFQ